MSAARVSWLRRTSALMIESVLALVLLVSALIMIVSFSVSNQQYHQVRSISTAITTISDLRAATEEVRVGASDYVLSQGATGQSLYLDSQSQMDIALRRFKALSGLNPRVQPDVQNITSLAPALLVDLQLVVDAENAGESARATQLLSAVSMLQAAQTLRAALQDAQSIEDSALRSQLALAASARQRATGITIVIAIIDVILLVACAVAIRNISQQREQLAAERAHAEEQAHILALEDTNRQMKSFLGIASHEIRTPLTSLKMSLQLALRKLQREPREQEAAPQGDFLPLLNRAMTSTGQLERLASDFVDVTQIESGTLSLRMVPLDLCALMQDCVAEQRLYHTDRSIALVTPDEPVWVIADGDRIRQVVANYLNNALKFSDIRFPVKLNLRVCEPEAVVSVRDYGAGIALEEQGRIWEQFYRASGSEHQSGSSVGFGLGLYICKSIIERHGGKVGVESAPGQGANFSFTLPLAHESNDDAGVAMREM